MLGKQIDSLLGNLHPNKPRYQTQKALVKLLKSKGQPVDRTDFKVSTKALRDLRKDGLPVLCTVMFHRRKNGTIKRNETSYQLLMPKGSAKRNPNTHAYFLSRVERILKGVV